MSTKVCLESICDRCATQTRDQYMFPHPQSGDVPLPAGWTGVRLGLGATRHLCPACTSALREWLKLGPEVP